MTTTGTAGTAEDEESYSNELPVRSREPGNVVIKWATTTDHKTIGTLYLVTSFAFFLFGGLLALFMRAELARPGMQIMSNEQYNQAFTMHGTIMLLMFATPLFAGFTNWIMPLQIGAPDVAFPPSEHVRVLAVPLRLAHRGGRLPHPRTAPPTSAGSPTPR